MATHDNDFPTRTTTRLLDALHDRSNEPVWEYIDRRFRPVIAGLARRLGLSDTDAEEVAQQTLSEFVRVYREGRYSREKGRLSSWILGIAHNTCRHALRARADADEVLDENDINPEALREIWLEERDWVILSRALDMLRSDSSFSRRTIDAFELVGLRAVPARQVAILCDMSTDEVYVAKARVSRRLRTLVAELTHAFEEDQ